MIKAKVGEMDVGLHDTIGGRIIFFIDLGLEFPLIMPYGVRC